MAFVKSLPMTYDETVVPVGEIARQVVVARRKGDDWYMGGLAGEREQAGTVSLNFLNEGRNYELKMVDDDGVPSQRTVRKGDVLSYRMRAGGGFVARLTVR